MSDFTQRNADIVQEYKEGATCVVLADKYGITRERICQILRPHGVIEDKAAQRIVRSLERLEKRIEKRRARQKLAEDAAELVRAGASWLQAAEQLGISPGTLQTIQKNSLVISGHGRWRDFSERRARIAAMRAEGKSWAEINSTFGINVYVWAASNMPELLGQRARHRRNTASTNSQTKDTAPSADPTASAVKNHLIAENTRSSEVI